MSENNKVRSEARWVTTVVITKEQNAWLKTNHVSLSGVCRDAIDVKMKASQVATSEVKP